MGVRELHPQYSDGVEDMVVCRDNFDGERTVKDKNVIYLPATEGQILDGQGTGSGETKGDRAYKSYKQRAIFYDFVKEAVEKAIGVIHRKPATIQLPKAMEPLRLKATPNNESLLDLLKNINVGQLIEGRFGLLVDIAPGDEGRDVLPYIATYEGTTITNWDNGIDEELTVGALNLVVLNESSDQRQDDFTWEFIEKYRVLILGELEPNEGANTGSTYTVVVVEPEEDDKSTISSLLNGPVIEPSIRGNKLNEIPFVFINSKDLNPEIDKPPLLGLSNLSLSIYRSEADYGQNLYMQGQDTFVVTGAGKKNSRQRGEEEETRVGAGASLNLPEKATAKYVGVTSKGLEEQREALQNNKKRADAKVGQTINLDSKAAESNDALQTRISAGTATLIQISQTSAKGLENSLKQIARWMGLDDEEVSVTANVNFSSIELAATELESFMKAKLLGAPISIKTIHRLLKERDVTVFDFEEEMDLIVEEGLEDSDEPAGPTPKE